MNYAPSTRARIADLVAGMRVDRAAALVTAATVNLFTVTGGRVLLTGFLGEVVAAIANTVTTLQITHLTTEATAVVTPLCIASADIAQYASGRMFTLPAAVGSVLTVSVGSSAALMNAAPTYALKVGGLRLVGSAAPLTGTIKWSVWYVPIDDGAYMTAA
uniref:Uncharacterized protein n=1 Tax=viral metagenome TaxID=1070528 RepID=A0A6M3LW76_9ZZZZ